MWRVYHTSIGRLLVAVVIANFYLGVHMSDNIANDNRKNWCVLRRRLGCVHCSSM